MPTVYIYAISSTGGKDPRLYECPVYRKPCRTDRTYIGSIDFETELSSTHWTLPGRGAALRHQIGVFSCRRYGATQWPFRTARGLDGDVIFIVDVGRAVGASYFVWACMDYIFVIAV